MVVRWMWSIVVVCVAWASVGSAAVLCANKKGAILRRESACKGKERPLVLSDFGALGPQGDKGDKGDKGDTGDVGPFVDTVPSGKTLRGTFFLTFNAPAGGAEVGSSISYGFRLSAEATPHFVAQGTTPPPECPGTPALPEAQAGHLCMYEIGAQNVSGQGICTSGSCGGTPVGGNRYGALFYAFSTNAGTIQTAGTWAVTAP